MTKIEESMYWHKTERHQFQNELKHLRTRQGRFDAAMLHLDHPLPGTDLYLDPSDHGRFAAAMYDEIEVVPLWLRLWRLAAARLPPRMARAISVSTLDWRYRRSGRAPYSGS